MRSIGIRLSLTVPVIGAAIVGVAQPAFATPFNFVAGDLVIDTVTAQSTAPGAGGGYGLDTAAPIVLQQYTPTGTSSVTAAGSLALTQSGSGANVPISGEYGSASEGFLQQSGNGNFLTLMGYGVNATTFNTSGGGSGVYGTAALGQTSNVTGSGVTNVSRVVGLIGANGSVDTTTAVTGVYNQNNPRSAYTQNGTSFYISGQGASKTDPTQGVFYTTLGSTTAAAIDNSTDTRDVQVVNNTLTVSRDYNPPGSGAQQSNVGTLTTTGTNPPTSSAGVTKTVIIPTGVNGSVPTSPAINPTAANANGINNSRIGSFVYASPEEFFYASPSVLYVADSGSPKNGNAGKAALGAGGLQKWVNSNPNGTGIWSLDYILYSGLDLVDNDPSISTGSGSNGVGGQNNDVTGLFGLTGEVIGNNVELFATSYTKNELDTTYLFGITDSLSATTLPTNESFSTLVTALPGEEIRGVSFAPIPEPASMAVMGIGLGALGTIRRRYGGHRQQG
jgi:PEP-CTERM motif